jgi:hypothetical protein
MIRTLITLLGCGLLLSSSLALGQDSTELEGTPLLRMSVSTLQLELQRSETELRDFKALIGRLETANKKSSNTDRERAIDNLREAMGNKILKDEEYLGEEHLIRKHGKEVDVVSTSEVEENTASGKLPQTGRRIMYEGPADTYNAFYRLVRMQEIFISCRTIESHAIAKAAPADQRYLSLVNQFAVLMEHDLEEMQNLLAEKEAALEARTVSPDASEGEEK